jgi:phosphohistidine phosphatase
MPQLEVWMMRHGEAADPTASSTDSERALTPRGRQQVVALARWLADRGEPPQLVLHSPLRRARETAEAFADGYAERPAVLEDAALSPGMRASLLLTRLRQQGPLRVVCVGHQPDVGQCISEWVGGARLQVPPGLLAMVCFGTAEGSGALRGVLDAGWFVDR